jgi:hypothetical protein
LKLAPPRDIDKGPLSVRASTKKINELLNPGKSFGQRACTKSKSREFMNRRSLWMLGLWVVAVALTGSILTSYHQPFLIPDESVLALVKNPSHGGWRMLHVVSGSCGCSQRVMRHLLQRHPMPGVTEQVLLVEDPEGDLKGTSELIRGLTDQNFAITRISAKDIPKQTGLRGVPMLVVASPENKVVYMGGYGSHEDQDGAVLKNVRTGKAANALPILGCAIGSRIRRQSDPFRLKY